MTAPPGKHPVFVIRIVDLVGIIERPSAGSLIGAYVRSFDPDAHDGRGAIVVTKDPKEARHFASYPAAFAEWKRQSKVQPVRPDGKPNRPMTAFSIEVIPLDQAVASWI